MQNKFRTVDCSLFQRIDKLYRYFEIHLLIQKFYNLTTVIQSPIIAIAAPALMP